VNPAVIQNETTPKSRPTRRKRIVVAVTGTTRAPLTLILLELLRKLDVEIHLVISTWGLATLKYELSAPKNTAEYFYALADHVDSPRDCLHHSRPAPSEPMV
jgi:4-hydroxy-3-polyprenylbenzoate decarboxylase